MKQQLVRRQPGKTAGGIERTAAHPRTMTDGVGRLQAAAGNRAARAVVAAHPGRGPAAALRAVTPRRQAPRLRPIPTAPMHRLVMRAWGSDGRWSGPGSPNRVWERRGSEGAYEYRFTNQGSFDDDSQHELQWKAADAWAALSINLPGAPVATPAPASIEGDDAGDASGGEEPDPDEIEGEDDITGGADEWDTDALEQALGAVGMDGVCNSLSTAYLLNLVTPTEGNLGINKAAFLKMTLFKKLLDYVLKQYVAYDSAQLTTAFLGWWQSAGLNAQWIADLTPSTLNTQAALFGTYFATARTSLPAMQSGAVAGKYDTLGENRLYGMADDVLEEAFDMNANFQGLVVVKATRISARGKQVGAGGHQLAIRYTASTHTFQIFDQNLGAASAVITEQEDISTLLAKHMRKYVTRPMPVAVGDTRKSSTDGQFEVQIFP